MENKPEPNNVDDSSLENAETVVEQPVVAPPPVVNAAPAPAKSTVPIASSETLDATQSQPDDEPDQAKPETAASDTIPKRSIAQRLQKLTGRLNLYVLLFALILLIGGIATYASFKSNKSTTSNSNISGQNLSTQDLQNLKNSSSSVGDATQTLTIASNSIFNGQVLMKSGLDVAGTIHVGGALSLPGITVSGTSAFNNIQVGNNLSIAGNAAVQGMLTVQKSISVNGGATFGGTISAPTIDIDQLILNKDLQLNRHIEPGGPTPHVSSGTAVGGGGTVSMNGSDTSGTVNINFGAGPIAGILANITFAAAFNQTPHVVISPVGSNCSALNYYVNRSTGGFSIGTSNGGPAGSSCSFDYIVMD
jgi:cytoskeletal protein CcmA (bactofilin family)